MSKFLTIVLLIVLVASFIEPKNISELKQNEVLVLGTIHSGHLSDSIYNIAYLEKLIREIKPDYILAEIAPDLFQEAVAGFKILEMKLFLDAI